MSKLRKRMIEDMDLAGLTPRTQEQYLLSMKQITQYFRISPDRITENQLREYLIYLYKKKRVAQGTFQVKYHGLKFFFYRTLGRDWDLFTKKKIRKPRRKRLPRPVGHDEFHRILTIIANASYRLCLSLMYSCGLRISEAVGLCPRNIDSKRMVIRVIGKGNKESLVPFPEALLEPMREHWKTHRNKEWLFPAKHGKGPMDKRCLRVAFRYACDKLGIDKEIKPHSLRHGYATRLLESGVHLQVVQALLRHGSIRSTQLYTHLTEPLRGELHVRVNELFSDLF